MGKITLPDNFVETEQHVIVVGVLRKSANGAAYVEPAYDYVVEQKQRDDFLDTKMTSNIPA